MFSITVDTAKIPTGEKAWVVTVSGTATLDGVTVCLTTALVESVIDAAVTEWKLTA